MALKDRAEEKLEEAQSKLQSIEHSMA